MAGQRVVSADEHGELYWDVERLWHLAEGLTPQTVPLDDLAEHLDARCWFGPDGITWRELADLYAHTMRADLSHPIIVSAEGWIMDGRKRLCKALAEGRNEILVVRFETTPEPDERVTKPPSAGPA